jgi:hypothetical protein
MLRQLSLRYDPVAMSANYNRLRLIGSCLLGAFFALIPALMFYKGSEKPQTLLIFVPLVIVFTRILLWIWRRGDKKAADSVRRRYERGKLPLGGREVGHVSNGKVRHKL